MQRIRMFAGLLLVLAVACSGNDNRSTSTSSTAVATGGSPVAAATVTQPKGELKVGVPFLVANLDSTKSGFSLLSFGVAETLTRLTPEFKIEPWLAQGVAPVDATTWKVTLRPNATFHDGSPVTAEDVAASFKRNWETQPAANNFISKDTQIRVIDPLTLEFKTPQPNGAFPNNLASFQFVVHKPGADGASIMTGPFKPVKLTVDSDLQLEAFTDHWAGPPAIAKVQVRVMPDANARMLALQAGDLDLITDVPAEMVKGLPNDFAKQVIPSTRVQYILLNTTRPPFSDRAVREAFSLGIDRATLNKVGFDGQSVVMTSVFRPGVGQEVVPIQSTNVEQAKSVLDAAGWRAGSDGIRVKDGRRLTVNLLSYPQRADLTPMALSIQAQLKPLGFDVQVNQVQDITKALEGGDFDASMYSVNLLPTGDPLYAYNQTLVKGGDWNYGKFANAQLDAVVEQLRGETDPAKRQALSKQVQEIMKAEVPIVYLVAYPRVFAFKQAKVRNFTAHPSDLYLLDGKIAVQ